MSWRRGLFRVWIVLSAIWVAGTGYSAFPDPMRFCQDRGDLSDWVALQKGQYVDPTTAKCVGLVSDKATDWALIGWQDFPDASFLEIARAERSYAAVVLGAPIALLLFGLTLGLTVRWVAAGFRRRP